MDYAWQNIKLIQSGNYYINPKNIAMFEKKSDKSTEITLTTQDKIKVDVPAYEIKNAMLNTCDERKSGNLLNLNA